MHNKVYQRVINEKFNQYDIDAMLIEKHENIGYWHHFDPDILALILLKGQKIIVGHKLQPVTTGDFEVKSVKSREGLLEVLNALPIKRLGFESKVVTFDQYDQMESLLKADLIPIKAFTETSRVIKTEDEIRTIAKAAKIVSDTFESVINEIKVGMTEKEVACLVERTMIEKGGHGLSFKTISVSGERTALPHGLPSDKIIKDGEFLTLDYGCIYNGYCSDMTRTLMIGRATEKQRQLYNHVLKAQEMAISALKPNVSCSEIAKIVADYFKFHGYYDEDKHGLGHGIGLEVHESPIITLDQHLKTQKNMVVTIEPGLYIESFGGVRIEDMVLVTEGGYELLTKAPKHLIEI